MINAPIGGVKILQHKFKEFLDYFYKPKRSVHGFVVNKSILTNAKEHKKRKHVINIDLENFFETITFARVYGIFKNKPFSMGHSAASVAAQLCTHNKKLPQGAPTSPVLSNLICTSLDRELMKLAKLYHMKYTRYADDITFSIDKIPNKAIVKKIEESSVYEIGELLKKKIIESGFLINTSKFRVQKKAQRQSVTGLIVNEKVNVSRKYIRQTRAMIHQWGKDPECAVRNFLNLSLDEKIDLPLAIIKLRNHIYGRLSFIRMVRGSDYSTYLRLCSFMGRSDINATPEARSAMSKLKMYDLFICHASEDKDDIAIPIYNALIESDITVFIDHENIKWGDSLTDKINTALAKSKYVIAILSKNSVDKNWPLKEINSVLAKEIGTNETKLLTLIKDGEQEYINEKLPLLNDKLYMVYKNNPQDIVSKFISRLKE